VPIAKLRQDFCDNNRPIVAGRIMAIRFHGKSMFYDVKDSGGKIQVYVKKDIVGDANLRFWRRLISVTSSVFSGDTFTTRTGEPTVIAKKVKLLSNHYGRFLKNGMGLPMLRRGTVSGMWILSSMMRSALFLYRVRRS